MWTKRSAVYSQNSLRVIPIGVYSLPSRPIMGKGWEVRTKDFTTGVLFFVRHPIGPIQRFRFFSTTHDNRNNVWIGIFGRRSISLPR